MSHETVLKRRNVAFCGHGSSGKTSLVDRLLVESGALSGQPSVDEETSFCDFDPVAKHHKHSIEPTLVHFTSESREFQVFDTPGYPDFIGHVVGALSAVETAGVVINAHAGIEVNTRRVFKLAGDAGLARFIVLNKLDDDHVDFGGLIESIRAAWGAECLPLNVPDGVGAEFRRVIGCLNPELGESSGVVDIGSYAEPLIESIVEVDEEVMERYFEGEVPEAEQLEGLLVRAISAGHVVPIVCCSARTGVGVPELLQALAHYAPSPVESGVRVGLGADGDSTVISPCADAPLVARVFRTRIDPFVQKLSFIRVYAGVLHKDDGVAATDARKDLKMGPLLRMQGERSESIDEAVPGEIVAVAKMDDLHIGTVLGGASLVPIPFPRPMVSLAVTPKSRGDEAKLSAAMHKAVEEDPTLSLEHDAQTHELVISGMSELHLAIVQEKLKSREHLEIETHDPKIPFRETIQVEAEGSYRHKKQSGGRGQFAEIHIRMFPFPQGTELDGFATKDRFPHLKEVHYVPENNFVWIDSVVGGVIPGNFMPAIEKGFRERLRQGVIAGYQVQDVGVEVHFGKHHPVDSSEAAFKQAARQVFRQVFEQARPSLLEPWAKAEVTVPEANVGDIYSDISSRGGRVSGTDALGGGMSQVSAEVPLREVSHYARTLSSITGGQGSYALEFSHYEVMPGNVQQEVVSSAGVVEEEEDS